MTINTLSFPNDCSSSHPLSNLQKISFISQTRRRHTSRITRIRAPNRSFIKPHSALKLSPGLPIANRKTNTNTATSVNSTHAPKRTIGIGRAGRILSARGVLAAETNGTGADEAEAVAGAGRDGAAGCAVASRVRACSVYADA